MSKRVLPVFNRNLALYLVTKDGAIYLDMTRVCNIQFHPEKFFHIEGVLPYRRDLLEIADGAEFIIAHCDCALAIQVFDNTRPFFRFTNCRVKSRYVLDSVNRKDDLPVCVDVVFECDVDIPEWGLQ